MNIYEAYVTTGMGKGELINQLAVTRQAFGYTKLTGPTPPLINGSPPTASTSRQPDDILSKKLQPKNICRATRVEEDPMAIQDIRCLRQGGRAALIQTK